MIYVHITRRLERRQDLIQWLKDNFEDHKIIDLMQYENEGKFLEGTGSIVFDYQGKASPSTSQFSCDELKEELGTPVNLSEHIRRFSRTFATKLVSSPCSSKPETSKVWIIYCL